MWVHYQNQYHAFEKHTDRVNKVQDSGMEFKSYFNVSAFVLPISMDVEC